MTAKGVKAKEIWKDGLPVGYGCECPICGEHVEAHYNQGEIEEVPYGELVWYPNDKVGKWCKHAKGLYAGNVFMF